MKVYEFRGVMNSIMKNQKHEKETFEAIIEFIKDEKVPDEVVFEKLNMLIEVF